MNLKIPKILTTFDLKILGLVLMVLDHVHEMFYTVVPDWFDFFGRPVATIFFFVSVEGFIHTRNQKKYLKRLLYGFWIMSIGNYVFSLLFQDGSVALINNIFGDIFIGVSTIYGINKFIEGIQEKNFFNALKGIILILLPVFTSALIIHYLQKIPLLGMGISFIYPSVTMAENNIFCYLIVLLYFVRKNRILQCVSIFITAIVYTGYTSSWQFNHLLTTNIQWVMIFAIIPIILYNSQAGKSMKKFFYIFYPAHIWFLYILASFVSTLT